MALWRKEEGWLWKSRYKQKPNSKGKPLENFRTPTHMYALGLNKQK